MDGPLLNPLEATPCNCSNSNKATDRKKHPVENDAIRGFNRSHIYSVERLEYSLDRLQKDRNTDWRVKAMEHTHTEGVSVRGLPARLKGEEGEEQFWFEGGSDADKRIRVEIQGAWLQNLPWHRAAHSQK